MIKVKQFYTDTCAPCKVVGKHLQELYDELDFELEFINAHARPELVQTYDVMGVPVIIINEETRLNGLVTKEQIKEAILNAG